MARALKYVQQKPDKLKPKVLILTAVDDAPDAKKLNETADRIHGVIDKLPASLRAAMAKHGVYFKLCIEDGNALGRYYYDHKCIALYLRPMCQTRALHYAGERAEDVIHHEIGHALTQYFELDYAVPKPKMTTFAVVATAAGAGMMALGSPIPPYMLAMLGGSLGMLALQWKTRRLHSARLWQEAYDKDKEAVIGLKGKRLPFYCRYALDEDKDIDTARNERFAVAFERQLSTSAQHYEHDKKWKHTRPIMAEIASLVLTEAERAAIEQKRYPGRALSRQIRMVMKSKPA